MPCIYLTLQRRSRSKEEIESVSRQTFISEEDQKINCCKNQCPVLKICDSVREHQPGVSYLLWFRSGASTRSLVSSTIPFGSINPESRIFCDSVRGHQPGVSYLLRFRSGASTRSLVSSAIPFGGINPESRIFYDSVREHQPEVSYLLRFRSGASTRSLVYTYDFVRGHQSGVSYFLFLRFHLRNVTIFRIKSDFRRKYKQKKIGSPRQNMRLLSLPYSWFSAMRKEGQL